MPKLQPVVTRWRNPEAVLCLAYAPIDLDGQVCIVVDVSPEVYELVRLAVH